MAHSANVISKIKLPNMPNGVEAYELHDAEAYHGTVGTGVLTVQANGTTKGTFNANATENATINITPADLGLSSVLNFRGTKDTATEITGLTGSVGDVWLCKEDNSEYVCVAANTWEKLGPTISLDGYVTKLQHNAHIHDVTVEGGNASSAVTGTFQSTDNFIKTATGKYLTASVSEVELETTGTATALTGVKASGTDRVLGEGTVFTATPTAADSSKMVITKVNSATSTAKTASKATAGAAVARGNADVGETVSVPNVTSNATVSIPNVTANVASDAIAATAANDANGTNFATWSGSVDEGILTISFSSGKYKASDATKTTLGTNLTATNTGLGTAISFTPAVQTTNTITPYTFENVACSEVSTSEVNVATGALASTGTGATVVTSAIKAVSVAADSTDRVNVVTGVEADGTTPVIGGVSVTAQPEATLSTSATSSTGAIAYIEATTNGKVSGDISGTAAAQTWSQTSGVSGTPKTQL